MCLVCGRIWCDSQCPEYDPDNDPSVVGRCYKCGTPLYSEGATDEWGHALCMVCAEERKGNTDD